MTTFQIVAPNKTTMFIIYNNKTNKIAIESVSSEAQPHIYTINIDDFINGDNYQFSINIDIFPAKFTTYSENEITDNYAVYQAKLDRFGQGLPAWLPAFGQRPEITEVRTVDKIF
jgi:1,4-alpha-glucan branching enzyme